MKIAIGRVEELRFLDNISNAARVRRGAAMVEHSRSSIKPLILGIGGSKEEVGIDDAIGDASAFNIDARALPWLERQVHSPVLAQRAINQGPSLHIDASTKPSKWSLGSEDRGGIGYNQRIANNAVSLENSAAAAAWHAPAAVVASYDASFHQASVHVSPAALTGIVIVGYGAVRDGA